MDRGEHGKRLVICLVFILFWVQTTDQFQTETCLLFVWGDFLRLDGLEAQTKALYLLFVIDVRLGIDRGPVFTQWNWGKALWELSLKVPTVCPLIPKVFHSRCDNTAEIVFRSYCSHYSSYIHGNCFHLNSTSDIVYFIDSTLLIYSFETSQSLNTLEVQCKKRKLDL